MNRGSANASGVTRMPADCFNEAPIHESGKCSTAGDIASRRRGFNEAPIHESGKS